MSARIASSLTDDRPNQHRQIGCMNGIFHHLFERHHFRRVGSHHNKRLIAGGSQNIESEAQLKPEDVQDKHKLTNDSSKILPLSQYSSTPSSLDSNKTAQLESPFSTQTSRPETPKSPAIKQHDSSLQLVKDSMYREARSLSIKTVPKGEGKVRVVKHIDSPRPLQPSSPRKRSDGSTIGVAKLQEAPVYSKEQKDNIMQRATRDSPRFSYDGRESRETLKTTMKLKEIPRLSLDSRVKSIQIAASESRSNFLLGEGNMNSICTPTTTREFGNHQRSSSSVVAKLMGLEGFSYSTPISEAEVIKDRVFHAEDSVSISSRPAQLRMKNQANCSPQVSRSDSSSPSIYGEMEKRITELEFKKSGKDLRALKQILEAMQKRITKAESEKQEPVMQTNRYNTDNVCYGQSPKVSVQKGSYSPRRPESSVLIMKSSKLNDKIRPASSHIRNREDSVAKERSISPRRNNIKNPSRHILREDKKVNERSSKAVHGSRASEQIRGQNHAIQRSSGAVSPRLQEKRNGMEKQSRLPPSELSRVRRHQTRQTKESGLQNRRCKLKSSNRKQGGDDESEISSDTRNFSEQGDTVSVQSESNKSLASCMDTEITSKYQYTEIGGNPRRNCKEMDPSLRLSEDSSMAEIRIATIEQPSPVSVLDAKFYIEGSPSPVKKISTAFRDYDDADDNEVEWHARDLDHLLVSTRQNLGLELNNEKFEHIELLIHKLRLLSSTPREDTLNQIASICQSDDPDHQYINKILMASGLLRDVDRASTTTWFYPTDHLINPKLLEVLEQAEESAQLRNGGSKNEISQLKSERRTHRKLVFDTVNEIVTRKLSPEGLLMRSRRCFSGHQLLKEVHTEMDYILPKSDSNLDSDDDELVSILHGDMKHESENWVESYCEIPAMVLDVERLIFKDLITEVINEGLLDISRGHCRQLFTK